MAKHLSQVPNTLFANYDKDVIAIHLPLLYRTKKWIEDKHMPRNNIEVSWTLRGKFTELAEFQKGLWRKRNQSSLAEFHYDYEPCTTDLYSLYCSFPLNKTTSTQMLIEVRRTQQWGEPDCLNLAPNSTKKVYKVTSNLGIQPRSSTVTELPFAHGLRDTADFTLPFREA